MAVVKTAFFSNAGGEMEESSARAVDNDQKLEKLFARIFIVHFFHTSVKEILGALLKLVTRGMNQSLTCLDEDF